MQHLAAAKASFEVYNSPLSEYAVVGFEYGYSAEAPNALVLWEAQFGDFNNGGADHHRPVHGGRQGQVAADVSAHLAAAARLRRRWARAFERAARAISCNSPPRAISASPTRRRPAQYFHLLRDQAKAPTARPFVVMTPKSLLRLRAASSRLADFTDGSFRASARRPVRFATAMRIGRLALCSGKIYYDLIAHAKRSANVELAIARVELLEPFPFDHVLALVESYPNVRQVTWVQEEPKNMGARAFVSRRIRERLTPRGIIFDYIGRPDRASPSEGYPGAHTVEQERIVSEVLSS